ncbi:unnamed protein product, partial [Rotaria sp. Silwood1]
NFRYIITENYCFNQKANFDSRSCCSGAINSIRFFLILLARTMTNIDELVCNDYR